MGHRTSSLEDVVILIPSFWAARLAAACLCSEKPFATTFHFGPPFEANRQAWELLEATLNHWQGSLQDLLDQKVPHDAGSLNRLIDNAQYSLNCSPRCDIDCDQHRPHSDLLSRRQWGVLLRWISA